jgi:hypothetical protein
LKANDVGVEESIQALNTMYRRVVRARAHGVAASSALTAVTGTWRTSFATMPGRWRGWWLTRACDCLAFRAQCIHARSKYKFMESQTQENRSRIKAKIPDIASSLEAVETLIKKQEASAR